METIARRLALVRESLGLSLRDTASMLNEAGYPVSHDAVHKYERGRKIPAEYVGAFCEAFGWRTDWILRGEGPPLDEAWKPGGSIEASPDEDRPGGRWADLQAATRQARADAVRGEWRRYLESGRAGDVVRSMILRSWERSRDADVDPEPDRHAGSAEPPRIRPEQVEDRRNRNRRLLEAADPDLDWLASLHRDIEHVVYLVCSDGIVLDSRAQPPELRETWSLLPGHDWSEQAMGTNGAGTALATGKPAAVIGPEHYIEGFHGVTCVGAPVVGPDSGIVGAIDLTTTLDAGDPRRLVVVAYAAANVSEKLKGGPEPMDEASGKA